MRLGSSTDSGCPEKVSTALRQLTLARLLHGRRDHLLVTRVHAVEGADGDRARSRGQRFEVGVDAHYKTTRGLSP